MKAIPNSPDSKKPFYRQPSVDAARTTRLLVSIESALEFWLPFEHGIEWIDLKNPSLGSLGRPTEATVRALERAVDGVPGIEKLILSVALGELVDYPQPIPMESDIFAYWKIGLSQCADRIGWQRELENWYRVCRHPGQLILVHYADEELASSPSFEEVCELSQSCGSEFVLVDTWQKGGKRLTEWIEEDRLMKMTRVAWNRGLRISLAGSLTFEDIVRMKAVQPDVWAVRSAACIDGDRSRPLCSERIKKLSKWDNIPVEYENHLKRSIS